MNSCRIGLLLSVFVLAVVFSGCTGSLFNFQNITTQGNCVSGVVTFCRNDSSSCNCTDEWNPVCGTDWHTYQNRCVAQCAGVNFTQGECGGTCAQYGETCGVLATTGAAQLEVKCCEGTCANGVCQKPDYYTCPDGTVVSSPDQCGSLDLQQTTPCLCIASWDPVCGVNGITYENKCVAMCKGAEIAYEGQCDDLCTKEGLPCQTVAGAATNAYVSNQTCCGSAMCINGLCQRPNGYTCADGSIVDSPNDCPTSDCGCPTEWNPVCLTSEGKTYPNICIARCGGIDPAATVPGECGQDICAKENNSCYRMVEQCKIDEQTGQKYCDNVTESNCCDNMVCSNGMCVQPTTDCALQGETCDNRECCNGATCKQFGGSLTAALYSPPTKLCINDGCRPEAERCVSDDECCSGICTNNQCAPTNGCLDTGKQCEKDGECCSQWCGDGVCRKREQVCSETGKDCKENWQCCSGICDPERYTCIDVCALAGETCSADKPCCPNSGAYCSDNGVCTRANESCNAEGARCGSPSNYLAAVVPSYGACCQGLSCINYYCGQPQACDCPDVYDPICGADGKTYGNPCRARCAGTYPLYNGPCRNETLCQKEFARCGRAYSANTNETYYYGDCCNGATCTNNICVPPQDDCPDICRQHGERCGNVQATDTLRLNFGDCCNGMRCIDNLCEGPNACVEPGGQCYVTPTLFTSMVNPNTYQGNCCDGSRCLLGTCRETAPGCNQTGQRCMNDNNCCQGACINNLCSPGNETCTKTGETCSPNVNKCCNSTDSCRQNPNIATHVAYSCLPGTTPTPTPTPACVQPSGSCTPGASICCNNGYTCVQNPNVYTHVAYWCSGGATPTPTPPCRQSGASCSPTADRCCETYLSCVQNPNVYTHVAYWCGVAATPTPTPVITPVYATCMDGDGGYGVDDIYYATYVQDSINGETHMYYDYCAQDGVTLYEYRCNTVPIAQAYGVQCAYGCSNGACNHAPTPTPTPYCQYEYCSDGVFHSTCYFNTQTGGCTCSTNVPCESQSCNREGTACYVPQATPTPTPVELCTDTDGDTAQNSYVFIKGTAHGTLVTGGHGDFTDYCTDASHLYEYDCESSRSPTVVAHIVPCDCNAGTCVPA